MSDVLTVSEAAALLRVSRKTVYRAVAEGTLPAFKVGTSIRLSKLRILAEMGDPNCALDLKTGQT